VIGPDKAEEARQKLMTDRLLAIAVTLGSLVAMVLAGRNL
jgi:hypothetical protein